VRDEYECKNHSKRFAPLCALKGGLHSAAMIGRLREFEVAVAVTGGQVQTEADLGVAVANVMALAERNGARMFMLTCILLQWAQLNAPKRGSEHIVADYVEYFKNMSAPPVYQATHETMWSLISGGLFRSVDVARSHFAVCMAMRDGKYEALVNKSGRLCYTVSNLMRVPAFKGLRIEERGEMWCKGSLSKLLGLSPVESATLRSVPAAPSAIQVTEVVDDQVEDCCFALCAMVCFL
jgi:hypothetical protein